MTSNPASVGPAPDGEWIEWSGGENPVPGQRVEVRRRYDERTPSFDSVKVSPSEDHNWQHDRAMFGNGAHIIAYRIAPHPDREAEPTGDTVVVPRAAFEALHRAYPGDPKLIGLAEVLDGSALSVSPPVVGGQDQGALQAQAPSVPTELEQRLVVALDRLSVTAETVRRMLHRDKERQGPAFREVGIPFTSAIENAKAVIRAYDVRHQPTTPGDGLKEICERIVSDYQTSETHHPNHVLITRADFEALQETLQAFSVPGEQGEEGA